jgi:hypothetical protein
MNPTRGVGPSPRNKTVVDAFHELGIQGRLVAFAQYPDVNFTWIAHNYRPWGGTYAGVALFAARHPFPALAQGDGDDD